MNASALFERFMEAPRAYKLLIVFLPLILIIYFGLQGSDAIAKRRADNNSARKALAFMQVLKAQGGVPDKNDRGPVLSTDAIKIESYIHSAAERANVTKPSVQRSETKRDGFVTVTGAIDLREVSLTQSRDFLRAIEQEGRAFAVTSLSVNKNFKDKEKVDLKLQVSGYALEQPAKPNPKDAKDGDTGKTASKAGGK